MKKTLTFATLHFTIAFSVAYVLTGDILIGSLIAMIEPSVNTVAFYFHEKAWASVPALKARQFMTKLKTASFATVHFSVWNGLPPYHSAVSSEMINSPFHTEITTWL